MDTRRTRPWASATRFTILAVLGAAVGLWWYGADYYLLAIDQRPVAPLHPQLGSAHSLGHGLGWMGIAMMVLLMVYSLRKRWRWVPWPGALGHWLSAHIFLGLMGPLLITFHSAFRVGGLVSISYWSMVITMLSGIFGRYVYVQIPSSVIGGHQILAELQAETDQLPPHLVGLLDTRRHDLLKEDGAWDPHSSGWRAIGAMLLHDLQRPVRRWRLAGHLRAGTELSRSEIRQVVGLTLAREVMERRMAAAESMERVFHYWHVLHRPFVWIMFLIAALHIGVAWWLGYRGF
jgi:hypothetical protein